MSLACSVGYSRRPPPQLRGLGRLPHRRRHLPRRQVDNRNSSAGKRARTDGGRREDDWTCPKCGNVNFSFRMTCNMHNCTQSRPADHNLKSAPKLLQVPPTYAPSAGYIRPGTPPSIYLGRPPYGSSVFGGPGAYSRQISGGSAYYDYGSRLSVNSPFGQLHLSGPPHYSGGSMLGSSGMYGLPPIIDRYGVGLPVGLGPMGPLSGRYSQKRSQEKPQGRENDWKCPNCGNNNFSFRNVCNMRKCNTPRPGSQVPIQPGSVSCGFYALRCIREIIGDKTGASIEKIEYLQKRSN